jgi:hypothetical protein
MDAYIRESRVAPITTTLALAAIAVTAGSGARADVTIEQHNTMNLASINMDMNTTERTTSDKQRHDSETMCHGFLAMFCRDALSGEIVRLDKQLEWQLDPKKKLYTEHAFPTPEQRALAQQKMQQLMDQMKQCPMPQPTAAQPTGPDTSHCQLTSPQLDVKQTDQHASVAGHDTQKSSIVLSQTCADPQTGDICEIDYGFDVWLTSDDIPGVDERKTFTKNYLSAQGLDPSNPQIRGMAQQFMAPYADSMKQLQSKSADLKGYPLRTEFYMAFGGPHCGKARQGQTQQTQAQAQGGGAARTGGFMHSLTSNAVSGALGGLFHRNVNVDTSSVGGQVASNAANQTADTATNAAANAAGNAAGNATAGAVSSNASAPGGAPTTPTTPSDKVRVVSFSTETISISTATIAADQFDIPAGWQLQVPKAQKEKEQQFTCPTTHN